MLNHEDLGVTYLKNIFFWTNVTGWGTEGSRKSLSMSEGCHATWFPELSSFPYLGAKLRSLYKLEQLALQLSIHGSPQLSRSSEPLFSPLQTQATLIYKYPFPLVKTLKNF